jgi:hypothetical protein
VRHTWSEQEKSVLARAVWHAPACGGTRSPWTLRIHGTRADIAERFPGRLWRHDGAGRDHVIACGAALATLLTGVRVLGWVPEVALLPDGRASDLVARVTACARDRPSPVDVRWFRAAFDLRRHHATVAPAELPRELVARVARAGSSTEVRIVPVAAYAPANRKQLVEPGLLVATVTDGHRDQVLAGVAMQQCWLAAKAAGLTASPQIEPFQFREFRQRMLRRSGVGGSPQLLLRLGR